MHWEEQLLYASDRVLNIADVKCCVRALLRGRNLKSAEADSPRTSSGTYQDPNQWLLGRIIKTVADRVLRFPPHIGIVQKPSEPFQENFQDAVNLRFRDNARSG